MKRVGKSYFAGVIAMLLIIFSAPYIRMLTDFMKNAVGVFFLIAFIYYLHDLVFSGFKKRSLILSTSFLLLTGITHILDFLTALLFLAIYTVLVLIFDVDRRSFMKSVGIITSIILAFIFVATTFFSSLFEDFNPVFYFIRDLMTPRINGVEGVKTIPNSFVPIQAGQHPLSRGVNVIGGWV